MSSKGGGFFNRFTLWGEGSSVVVVGSPRRRHLERLAVVRARGVGVDAVVYPLGVGSPRGLRLERFLALFRSAWRPIFSLFYALATAATKKTTIGDRQCTYN